MLNLFSLFNSHDWYHQYWKLSLYHSFLLFTYLQYLYYQFVDLMSSIWSAGVYFCSGSKVKSQYFQYFQQNMGFNDTKYHVLSNNFWMKCIFSEIKFEAVLSDTIFAFSKLIEFTKKSFADVKNTWSLYGCSIYLISLISIAHLSQYILHILMYIAYLSQYIS